jgi:sigma-E factor negative regulatory protein RseC
MAQKKGRVSRIENDGWAVVVTEKSDACSNCESAQFCHALADCSRLETRVLNQAGAKVGDTVSISLSSRTVIKSAMILYILPTVTFLLGAVVGAGLHKQLGIGDTGAAIVFGFAGLFLGFAIARLISNRKVVTRKLIPVITQIIKPKEGIHPSRMPAGNRAN